MISVGIDVSKEKSTICIMKPGGEILATPYDMLHTIENVNRLANRILAFDEETRVVLEATGHYHRPVADRLMENGIFVCCVNALRMKNFCSQNLRRAKTDKIDSIKIASYGITYWSELQPMQFVEETYQALRLYSRQHYRYLSLLVQAKVNLCNLLDQAMPGIQRVLVDQCGKHKLTDFVSRYWHFSHITTMGQAKFCADCCKWAKKGGYRVNERQAQELYALAQNGIPVLPCNSPTKIIVSEAVRALRELEESRDTILAYMRQLASSLPEYSVVRAMNGIGESLAPCLIAEIGDVRRFRTHGALVAYAGIDAPPYQSGSFNATNRNISKRGNKYLRKFGFEVMQVLARVKPTEDPVYLFIQKKELEGKSKNVAKIAGLNKFLRIYYARVNEVYRLADEQLIFGSSI